MNEERETILTVGVIRAFDPRKKKMVYLFDCPLYTDEEKDQMIEQYHLLKGEA